MPKELATYSPNSEIARVAGRQHGVVTSRQLVAAGLFPSGISDRVTTGRLHRLYRGVYAVGHIALSNEGRWMAAVLAYGESAVLSHRSAGALWRILQAPRPGGAQEQSSEVAEVTVPGDGGRAKRQGIRLHRSRSLSPADVTLRVGIPVTRPARTLEDLRRILRPAQFGAALRQAEFLGLPLGDQFPTDRTQSELEARFLAICRRHRLPQPDVNARVGEFVVDFLWPSAQLIVEVDGWTAHRTRSAFEADRARDARLKLLGYEVLRFTWRQVQDDGTGVMRTVRALFTR
jgi:very-short-patch-repair endonuclease